MSPRRATGRGVSLRRPWGQPTLNSEKVRTPGGVLKLVSLWWRKNWGEGAAGRQGTEACCLVHTGSRAKWEDFHFK